MLGRPSLTPRGGDTGRIIAVERDRRITSILRELVMPYGNVEVWEQDVLQLLRSSQQRGGMLISGSVDDRAATVRGRKPRERGRNSSETGTVGQASGPGGGRPTSAAGVSELGDHWKLAANLPYSITSDFLRLLFDAVGTGALLPPERAVLLLQREVVDRMCADPSRHREHRNVGLLTILTQLHCSPRRIARVPAAHFWPQPKVESAVVALEGWRKKEELVGLLGGPSRDNFLHLIRTCFAYRRRQIGRVLKGRTSRLAPHASSLMTARPETLTLAQWIALARALPRN